VTDVGGPSNGAYSNKLLTFTVASGLKVWTGIEYTNSAVVNTNGTAVTWVSGPKFSSRLAGAGIFIGTIHPVKSGANYTVLTVNSPTSLTLTTSAGVQSGMWLNGDVNGSLLGQLGYVDKGNISSISPCPNLSFYLVATGVITTDPSQLKIVVGTTPNLVGLSITATVVSLSGGVAIIQLASPGISTVKYYEAGFDPGTFIGGGVVSVTDSGVIVGMGFTWLVYQDGTLRLAPASGSFPTKFTTPT
jgi:hypothetical protein